MANIYDYLDYRKFLQDVYEERKAKRSMSFRSIGQALGVSHQFVRMVFEGKRNLKPEHARRFAELLHLKKNESAFFVTLVAMNQAVDAEAREGLLKKLMAFKQYQEIHPFEHQVYQLLSKWYIAAVHELVALKDFDSDPWWIASKLKPRITIPEAKEAIAVLVNLNLIKVDPRTGKARQVKGELRIPPDIADVAVGAYHTKMLSLAQQAIKGFRKEEREMTGLTIALSREQFREVKEKVRRFELDLHAEYARSERADAVYQISLQLFPLSSNSANSGTFLESKKS